MTQSEIEKLLDAAANDDVSAMLDLGDYAVGANTQEGLEHALHWYTNAANNGSLLGNLKAMIVHKEKAATAKSAYDWDSVLKHIDAIVDLYRMLPQDEDLPEDFVQAVLERYYYAIYYLAVVQYFKGDKLGAMSTLNDIDAEKMPTPVAYILMACSYFSQVDKEEELSTAYTLLSPLEKSPEEIVAAAMDHPDEVLLSQGFGYLAIILRIKYNDMQRAYNVLNKGYELLTIEDIREILAKEMARYRPKLFGGLQYV